MSTRSISSSKELPKTAFVDLKIYFKEQERFIDHFFSDYASKITGCDRMSRITLLFFMLGKRNIALLSDGTAFDDISFGYELTEVNSIYSDQQIVHCSSNLLETIQKYGKKLSLSLTA